MTLITVTVVRKTQEALGIAAFELTRPDGLPLPPFSAGSHIDVVAPTGITRQYSLCNDPQEHHRYRIAVLRDPASRGGSLAMHDLLGEGDSLQISGPRNHFPLVHARRTLLFAGGIGVTPLLCMAQRLQAIGADFTLHYSTRSADRTAFRDEIATSSLASHVCFHFDGDPSHQALDTKAALGAPAPGTHVYVCGPAGYIDHIIQTAQGLGWPDSQLHREYFAGAPQDHSGDRAFQVKVASNGQTYEVGTAETVVHVLRKHGIEVVTACEQGVCGTCITRVLEGECDHRDLYLTDEEKAAHDQFTPCCSRAKTSMLVLDL